MMSLLRVALPLIAAGCASDPERLLEPRTASGVELRAFAAYAECFLLAEGERVAYRFTATRPVAFSVYAREGNTRIIPVEVPATVDDAGDFSASRAQTYCLEWEAGPAGSVIDYRVQQVRPRR
jgi:hypothetical protein